MFTKKPQTASWEDKKNYIKELRSAISSADKIVIGGGAGLSAAAGLNYMDQALFKDLYKPFLKKGYQTITEAMSYNWQVNEHNARTYWGFWANHINNIYYSQPQLETYKKLFDIIKDKEYFIITTNADGQFYKKNYDPKRIYAMQGSYGLFQCQKACHQKTYPNKELVEKMLMGFDENSLEIASGDIPRCPECGGLLIPNLRIDQYFVETGHQDNRDAYLDFVDVKDEKIVFMELGVGYNTPVIIRFPFEQLSGTYKNAKLFRVNMSHPTIPKGLEEKGFGISMDIDDLLSGLLA